jgi:hypothetical protein
MTKSTTKTKTAAKTTGNSKLRNAVRFEIAKRLAKADGAEAKPRKRTKAQKDATAAKLLEINSRTAAAEAAKSNPRVKAKITELLEQDAVDAAERENTKKRKERKASKDGKAASERAMDVTDRAIAEADGFTTDGCVGYRSQPEPACGTKLSMIDAAAIVFAEDRQREWDCKSAIAEMARRNLWVSPAGKTPHATLNAALLRDITKHGAASRFKHAGKGRFCLAGGAA